MRKVFVSLLAISFFILYLSGCVKQSEITPQLYFECDAVIYTNDSKTQATLTCSKSENINISVKKTDTLFGFEYQCTKKNIYIRYNQLECCAQRDYLAYFNPFSVLIETLCCLQRSQYEYVCLEGDFCVLKTKHLQYDCKVFVDRQSGYIKKIEPDIDGIKIELSYD